MAAVAKLLLHTPGVDLKVCFTSRCNESLGPSVARAGPKNTAHKRLFDTVNRFDEMTRNRLTLEADRIETMTQQLEQTAILSVVAPATRVKLTAMDSHYTWAV